MTLFWGIIFIVSIAVLVKSSDWFTKAAESFGFYLGASPFIIGVTIVSIGTSLPELISSIVAVTSDAEEIVIANVVGSNIANIFLVLGIAAIIGRKITIAHDLQHVDMPIMIGATFLFTAMLLDGTFSLFDAILSIALLFVYFGYTVHAGKKQKDKEIKKELKGEIDAARAFPHATIFILAASALLIYIGAKFTIEAVINLAEIFHIGADIIAVTAIAIGTSLPEVIVSALAAYKGKTGIAVGNILGSNIFNVLAVTGISAFFGALTITANILTFGIPVLLLATFMYYFITQDKDITHWEGWMLIIFYVFFLGGIVASV